MCSQRDPQDRDNFAVKYCKCDSDPEGGLKEPQIFIGARISPLADQMVKHIRGYARMHLYVVCMGVGWGCEYIWRSYR